MIPRKRRKYFYSLKHLFSPVRLAAFSFIHHRLIERESRKLFCCFLSKQIALAVEEFREKKAAKWCNSLLQPIKVRYHRRSITSLPQVLSKKALYFAAEIKSDEEFCRFWSAKFWGLEKPQKRVRIWNVIWFSIWEFLEKFDEIIC